MDDYPSSILEKEPFLLNRSLTSHRRKAWNQKLVVAIWLTSHVILFATLGGVLVLVIKNTIRNAAFFNGSMSTQERQIEFGGLPVQYDDPNGPYVICPSDGGPSAALQAGCKFDLFANGWTPSPCFDMEKHDYFVNQHDYYFWEDTEKRHRIHQEKILEGTIEYPELFVSFEEHYEHCRYLLNATKRYAYDRTLGALDIHLDEEHMNHCIDFLSESRDPYTLEVGVIAYFGYRKCFLPRSDKVSVV